MCHSAPDSDDECEIIFLCHPVHELSLQFGAYQIVRCSIDIDSKAPLSVSLTSLNGDTDQIQGALLSILHLTFGCGKKPQRQRAAHQTVEIRSRYSTKCIDNKAYVNTAPYVYLCIAIEMDQRKTAGFAAGSYDKTAVALARG